MTPHIQSGNLSCALEVLALTTSGQAYAWATSALVMIAALLLAAISMRKSRHLRQQLKEKERRAADFERQRDTAQGELFRRLYEERELNRQKLQFEAQLSEYEKYSALAQLALGAAHEINNPLLGILSHLELELKGCEDPAQRAEIEQCIAGAKRISSTLRGLVNYARPSPPVWSKIILARLVADTIAFLENQPMLRGKNLTNDVPADLPPIRADANQLSQVLMNLLLNSAEATPEGGRITVSASKLTYVDSIEIRVNDTGSGMPAEVLAHVFEPFFTTKRGKGTGLGLSISHAYIRSHGGDMRVDSIIGRGTTVTLTLPLRLEQEPDSESEQSQVVV
ncbi:MAG TPA: ATP-binding protein [Terriglobales bacterium]|nr:ATP-binding protein [Terriglobales bacterium]